MINQLLNVMVSDYGLRSRTEAVEILQICLKHKTPTSIWRWVSGESIPRGTELWLQEVFNMLGGKNDQSHHS